MELLRCTRLDLHFRVFSNSTTILKPLKQFPSLNYGVPIQNMQLQVRAEVARREENPSQVEVNKSSLYVDGVLRLQKSHITEGIQGRSELIFLGTGTSEGIPRVSCLTHPSKECSVCWAATRFGNKNRRRNTSIVIRVGTSSSRWKTILIDAGKYFYHSALQWFPYYGIRELDAVLLTHSHADAAGGLDDLRDWTNNIQATAQVYATCRDLEVLAKTHYYLVDTSVITAGTAVSNLQFTPISEDPFFVCGLKVTPLPVWHGAGYRSLGFRVGDICYISDVSGIPEETYPLLSNCEILILDALRPDYSTATHFGLPQALKEVRKIRPNRTLFTGMMHLMDHDKINELLAQLKISEGLDAELSYDGLQISINLG
ncbi:hypothetical protein O6H91_04G098600 [Diphasiastrum complanatum]|uniref:Uncharacterized protein n=1 Tax=Diphasiastrum complanatum TaxID=34168 RepID=A0ACC2E036_DIPCM|nr:hypothetical protein O6H91_04G098600 [Diphasiastrum complanatum]